MVNLLPGEFDIATGASHAVATRNVGNFLSSKNTQIGDDGATIQRYTVSANYVTAIYQINWRFGIVIAMHKFAKTVCTVFTMACFFLYNVAGIFISRPFFKKLKFWPIAFYNLGSGGGVVVVWLFDNRI